MRARSLHSTAMNGRCKTRGRLGAVALGITCLLGVLLVSAPSYGTQSVNRRTTRSQPSSNVPMLISGGQRVRVTAANLDGAKRQYVINYSLSKAKGIVYVLDGTSRPMDYSRIIVRTQQGDTKLDAFLKKTFPTTDLRGLNAKQVTLSIMKPSQQRTNDQLKAPGNQSGYVCRLGICACSGTADCNKLINSGKCHVIVCYDNDCVCA